MGINASKFVRGAVVSAIITGAAVVGLGLSPANAATAPTFPGINSSAGMLNTPTNSAANSQAIANQLAKPVNTTAITSATQSNTLSLLQNTAANKAATANKMTTTFGGLIF